jgi:hypothetical protein
MNTYQLETCLQAPSGATAKAQEKRNDPAPSRQASDTLVSMVSRATHHNGQRKTRIGADSGLDHSTINRRRNEVLLSTQGRTADDVWTCAEWTKLSEHLHNENGDRRFVMGFRKYGVKQYVRSKNVPVDRGISWGWDSIRARAKTNMAFTPYSMNNRKQSRWGALDFDAHDGEHERARTFAFAAFHKLLDEDLVIILESSGAGWHVWAISQDFHPVGWWIKLLKAVTHAIGAPIRDGVCEIFPPDTLPENSEFGCAMRAPGSWNPGTETLNLIWWQNTKELTDQLTNKRKKLLSIPQNAGDDVMGSSVRSASNDGSGLYRAWSEKWSVTFRITSLRTRNDQLSKLVGQMFPQVGHDMARRIAEEQFRSRTVKTVASLPKHMESFSGLWRGLRRRWRAGLTQAERRRFDDLDTENLKDAFRIVRSYQRLAVATGATDFPVAAQNLGERLGVSLQGACKIRDALVNKRVIARTAPYQRHAQAARYRWTCDGSGQNSGGSLK